MIGKKNTAIDSLVLKILLLSTCLEMWLWLFFKIFFMLKYIKMILIYFLKLFFRYYLKYKKKLIFNKKLNFYKTPFVPRSQTVSKYFHKPSILPVFIQGIGAKKKKSEMFLEH